MQGRSYINLGKLHYLGNILREETYHLLLQDILQGKLWRKRSIGRRVTCESGTSAAAITFPALMIANDQIEDGA